MGELSKMGGQSKNNNMLSARWLSLSLIVTLVLLTPGGSTCLPLPDGRHVHIGWTDREGHDSPVLIVFQHTSREPVKGSLTSTAFSPGSATTAGNVDSLPTMAVVLIWAVPHPTVLWAMDSIWVMRRQPQPTLPLRPPRWMQSHPPVFDCVDSPI